MEPNALARALGRAPKDMHWLILHGVDLFDLPSGTRTARQWTAYGWRQVWYIPPRRVSRRWAAILSTFKVDGCGDSRHLKEIP